MIGERENNYPDTNYGTLVMRAFDIDGNQINAFYDASDNLVFVLDNTMTPQKTNVLLVINPDGDKKWDEILSAEYGVDLETIRPKVDNKYQKLDIEYSGLAVYDALINAYKAGDALDEHLNQLNILRDSAVRHSAMMRLNAANETISKTNATIVKTKESIVRLEARVKTLRSKLSATKKEIGKVNTKQSASKILKIESQIEATQEKLKRAKKRLESAQKRLEAATVDAELASDLLNQPSAEMKQITKSAPVMVAPEYPVQTMSTEQADEDEENEYDDEDEEEETKESDVKPLFAEDPQILNDNIAFKPISFDAPVFDEEANVVEEIPESEPVAENKPVLESMTPIPEPEFIPEPVMEEKTEIIAEKPVLETMIPVVQEEQPIVAPVEEPVEPVVPEVPVENTEPVVPVTPVVPVVPVVNDAKTLKAEKEEHSKPGFVYYILLLVLILLSVFTLWLYQKNTTADTKPVLTAKAEETQIVEKKEIKETTKPVVEPVMIEEDSDSVFLDEEEPVSESKPTIIEKEEPVEEGIVESVSQEEVETVLEEDEEPVVEEVVVETVDTSFDDDSEEMVIASEEDVLATKPVYEPGAKHDDMFVNEDYNEEYDDFLD